MPKGDLLNMDQAARESGHWRPHRRCDLLSAQALAVQMGTAMPRAVYQSNRQAASGVGTSPAKPPCQQRSSIGAAEGLMKVAEEVINITRAFDAGYTSMQRYLTEAPRLAKEFRSALEAVNEESFRTVGGLQRRRAPAEELSVALRLQRATVGCLCHTDGDST